MAALLKLDSSRGGKGCRKAGTLLLPACWMCSCAAGLQAAWPCAQRSGEEITLTHVGRESTAAHTPLCCPIPCSPFLPHWCSDVMASVESVKAASDVYAPVSGRVVEANTILSTDPGLVNQSAEDKAWFVKMEVGDAVSSETAQMMQPEAYKKHCEAEAEHH